MLYDENSKQLRNVVAVGHVGFALVVQSRKELAGGRFAFLELGYFVELRACHGEVCLRLIFRGRFAEFGVQEESEEGHGDDVGGECLFIIFGHSETIFP